MTHPEAPRLLDPLVLRGGLSLSNRIVMAPMTRSRAEEPGDLPSVMAPTYYQQRASAGLVVTEGTVISPLGKGYSLTPGIYSSEQIERWSAVSEAVHRLEGSRIFMQLWHVGRISNDQIAGGRPIAPSAVVSPTAKVWYQRADGWQGNIPCSPPREMSQEDIDEVVTQYKEAARRALDSGMDGVEIHAANGYLIDQFLRSTTNRRSDAYGGGIPERIRFLREVVQAVVAVTGPSRVGVRLSPDVDFGDTLDPEILETTLRAVEDLETQCVAYVHLVESNNANYLGASSSPTHLVDSAFKAEIRRVFHGSVILAHDYNEERASRALAGGEADAVAFGRPFIANPDLVARIGEGLPIAPSDRSTWYGGDHIGYTDYPFLGSATTVGK
ncbi:alkene reductase [Kribbella sancticallisti]|uniref:Alkene reductase n=1 Tax=Kribbella sancticallisti TaxID=460087 RepID=A0ABP4QUZ5_9ACTN